MRIVHTACVVGEGTGCAPPPHAFVYPVTASDPGASILQSTTAVSVVSSSTSDPSLLSLDATGAAGFVGPLIRGRIAAGTGVNGKLMTLANQGATKFLVDNAGLATVSGGLLTVIGGGATLTGALSVTGKIQVWCSVWGPRIRHPQRRSRPACISLVFVSRVGGPLPPPEVGVATAFPPDVKPGASIVSRCPHTFWSTFLRIAAGCRPPGRS